MNNKQIMQPCTENYKTRFGWTYKIPKQSCLLCNNCEKVILDSEGPYMFTCYKAIDENGIIDVYKMGGPYGNCSKFEQKKNIDTITPEEQEQRDYEAAVEMTEYCERYEPTYNQEDGSM